MKMGLFSTAHPQHYPTPGKMSTQHPGTPGRWIALLKERRRGMISSYRNLSLPRVMYGVNAANDSRVDDACKGYELLFMLVL